MWHLATSKRGKVLLATETWRKRPGIPGERHDPYLPSSCGQTSPAVTCGPLPGAGDGPRGVRGWDRGACKRGNNRVHSGNVSAGPSDSSASPTARGHLAFSPPAPTPEV